MGARKAQRWLVGMMGGRVRTDDNGKGNVAVLRQSLRKAAVTQD